MPGHATSPFRSLRAARDAGDTSALRSVRAARAKWGDTEPLRSLRSQRDLPSGGPNPIEALFIQLWNDGPKDGTADAPFLMSRTDFASVLSGTPDPAKAGDPYVDSTTVPGLTIIVAPDDQVTDGWESSWEYVTGVTGVTDSECPCFADTQAWDCLQAILLYHKDNPDHFGGVEFAPDDPNAAHYHGVEFAGSFTV